MANSQDEKLLQTTASAPVAGSGADTSGASTDMSPTATASPDTAGTVVPIATTVSPYTTLKGVSASTAEQLGRFTSGSYTPSESVLNAQNYLNGIMENKPGQYTSKYQSQLDSLYDQIMNREKFTYDLNGDALYNQYKQMYTANGKRAMQDTMGQAAALTGGYGSSYSQMAGQQAYDQTLSQLNDIVPELYQQAYNRYQQEGQDLQNMYQLTMGAEDADYGRYRDTLTDWNTDYNRAYQSYWDQYNSEQQQYLNDRQYYTQLAQQENAQWTAERDYAYNFAMGMLQSGLMPDSNWLDLAGISKGDAKEMQKYYKALASRSSGGGGGGYSAPKTTTTAPKTTTTAPKANTVAKPTTTSTTKTVNNINKNAAKIAQNTANTNKVATSGIGANANKLSTGATASSIINKLIKK